MNFDILIPILNIHLSDVHFKTRQDTLTHSP